MRSVIMDRVDRPLLRINEARRMNGSDKAHRVELGGFVEQDGALFQSPGRKRASQALDNFEATLPEAGTTGEGSGHARFAFDILGQRRSYIENSENVRSPVKCDAGSLFGSSNANIRPPLQPMQAEELSAPWQMHGERTSCSSRLCSFLPAPCAASCSGGSASP
jgi:hypothetical protein